LRRGSKLELLSRINIVTTSSKPNEIWPVETPHFAQAQAVRIAGNFDGWIARVKPGLVNGIQGASAQGLMARVSLFMVGSPSSSRDEDQSFPLRSQCSARTRGKVGSVMKANGVLGASTSR
jgi:hypothetical protein